MICLYLRCQGFNAASSGLVFVLVQKLRFCLDLAVDPQNICDIQVSVCVALIRQMGFRDDALYRNPKYVFDDINKAVSC